jgi:hypothetical protein
MANKTLRSLVAHKVGVEIRVKNVTWLAMRRYDERREMIRDRGMVWRSEHGVDCSHGCGEGAIVSVTPSQRERSRSEAA